MAASGSQWQCRITVPPLGLGDSVSNQEMIGDHTEGFGLLANAAIDQHVLARNQ